MSDRADPTRVWCLSDREIRLDAPVLLGVLNMTPDSFSDGGMRSIDEAIGHALRMIEEGAAIIDVGGESVRPGAERVSSAEQIDRTAPVIEQLREHDDIAISIDTTRADVARSALDAGASIVNDVSAGQEDQEMFPLAAARGCGLILMHRLRPPESDSYSDRYEQAPAYDDVLAVVREFLRERTTAAEAAGVRRETLVIDPGLGFGKSVQDNFELIRRTPELHALGYPVLGAASRKSFLGAVTGIEEPRRRVTASVAASVAHALAGVRLFRVHDVAAHVEALAVTEALLPASKGAAGVELPTG